MIEKFFLALDYQTDVDVVEKGLGAIDFLQDKYGENFVRERIGVKINEDVLTGKIDKRFRKFEDKGCSIFADMKISHGYDTGERIIRRLCGELPVSFVTVSANLGREILSEYVKTGNQLHIKIIAFTVHTKISQADAERIYRQVLTDAIYNLVQISSDAGCDAAVMEASMLNDPRIRDLPIKKLVTGIRLELSDKGTQQRVSDLKEVTRFGSYINYAVISSRYLEDHSRLAEIFAVLSK